MMVIGWDTETALIRPGVTAPELSCVTHQTWDGKEAGEACLTHWTECYALVKEWLVSSSAVLVGANVAYDMGVLGAAYPDLIPAIFQAYEENRVTDVQIRQKLIDIGMGRYRGYFDANNVRVDYKYSLADLTFRYFGVRLDKDAWRLKYGILRELPLADWPEGARTYPKDDARWTLALWVIQERHKHLLQDEFRQARAAWWLHLMSAWGLRTKADGVDALRQQTLATLEDIKARLIAAGFVRADGSRDTKAAKAHMTKVCQEEGLPLRMTKTGGISLDSEACEATGDALLQDYADLTGLNTVLDKDVPALASGTVYPVHSRFDLAETGRTTSSKPNVQNWRRLPGIRECFVPRPGYVYAQADYEGLELRTLAQACITLLGKSRLGEVLNAGKDPHLQMAAGILGISYEEASKNKKRQDVDDARQTAKVANFGFPGGLGPKRLIEFAKSGYNVTLSEMQAKKLKEQWLNNWPEMKDYFQMVRRLTENKDKLATLTHIRSNRVRGGATYTAACNSFFQGLGSDATKHAGFLIAKACYVDRTSPLFGCRIVNYVHDEFILEVPEGPHMSDAALELERLMCAGANEWLPDVPAKAPPLLMRFWSKKAEAVYDESARLIPWPDKKEFKAA